MPDREQTLLSICTCIFYFFLIALMMMIFSGFVTLLTFLMIVPLNSMMSFTFGRTPVTYTETWSLIFSTSHNSTDFVPKDFDGLARSIDRMMNLDFPSTIVKSAYFTKRFETDNMTIESKNVYLNLQIQLQYPRICAEIDQCEELFRYRTLSKIIEQQSHQVSILLTNDERVNLRIQLEQIDERTTRSAGRLNYFTIRRKNSVESETSCTTGNHRSCSDSSQPPIESK